MVEIRITGGKPLTLPAGEYEVHYRWNGEDVAKKVAVAPEQQAMVGGTVRRIMPSGHPVAEGSRKEAGFVA